MEVGRPLEWQLLVRVLQGAMWTGYNLYFGAHSTDWQRRLCVIFIALFILKGLSFKENLKGNIPILSYN